MYRGMFLLLLTLISFPGFPAEAQSKRKPAETETPSGPREYSSKNFRVLTDLPDEEAKDLLKRLETMLGLVSKYWGRPLRSTIYCHVVKDVDKWPQGVLDPQGEMSIRSGGGITLGKTLRQGEQFLAEAPVYAVADRGTPQHEAVHAYCILTFGRTGPTWYSEGMAEMGQYWVENDEKAVHAHEGVIKYLRGEKPKDLIDIVDRDDMSGDSWQNYAWRWALCHLLAYNTNYSARFRPLGLSILMGREETFETVYGPMAKEINFEYHFFLNHLEKGYRVDLCSWDWKTKFNSLKSGSTVTSRIESGRGWQATRGLLENGTEYEFSAEGSWKTDQDSEASDAEGNDEGVGKLVGIIFKEDYTLSEPFDLGKYGKFTAPADGKLYVRCQDGWSQLNDNSGRVQLKVKNASKGKPLPIPVEKPVPTRAPAKKKATSS